MTESSKPISLCQMLQQGGRFLVTTHLGQAEYVTPREWQALTMMEGFHTCEEIAASAGLPVNSLLELCARLEAGGYVTDLDRWNRLSWCPECRVYVLSQQGVCRCGRPTDKVELMPPCDTWILFPEEHRMVRELARDRLGLEIREDAFLLGNWGVKGTIPFWEIVFEGRVMLRICFEGLDRRTWRVAPGESLPHANASGRAVSERTGAVRSGTGHATEMNEYIDLLVEHNRQHLDSLARRSHAIMETTFGLFPSLPMIYFSGGKESMVMAHLMSQLGIECNLLFVATGMDQPDDVGFFHDVVAPWSRQYNRFHLHVFTQDSSRFLALARENGVLSSKNPWCRTKIKMPLKHKATSEIYGSQYFTAYEGSRKYETNYRRRYATVNFPRNYPNQVWVHPIADWTGLEVWLYLISNRLPVSPVYLKGFQKTTCWCCPLVQPYHLERSRALYPELWASLNDVALAGFDDRDSVEIPY
ncbi:MAG: phosphoadenosine phosphosulfate reductase family protein [Firmicutes bacterium]|nr:phosphoadenosine phosphosulfate reductase family protein [Bacillota bacterium]MDH7495773.1 phosphoadenosine phosphosulfate reductase family protein [Bacillota bacterium]